MMNIYNSNGEVIASVTTTSQSVYHAELMTSEYVLLCFNSTSILDIPLGAYIEYKSAKYYITEQQKPTAHQNGGYSYRLQFNAEWYKWKGLMCFYDRASGYEAGWKMTNNLKAFTDIIKSNLEREGYQYPVNLNFTLSKRRNELKYIEFESGTDILSALSKIAEAYEYEWWVKDGKIFFGDCNKSFVSRVTITDKDIKTISENDSQDKNLCTRLYAFGSDRNISKKYRKKLLFTAQSETALANAQATAKTAGYSAGIIDDKRPLEGSMFRKDDDVVTANISLAFDKVESERLGAVTAPVLRRGTSGGSLDAWSATGDIILEKRTQLNYHTSVMTEKPITQKVFDIKNRGVVNISFLSGSIYISDQEEASNIANISNALVRNSSVTKFVLYIAIVDANGTKYGEKEIPLDNELKSKTFGIKATYNLADVGEIKAYLSSGTYRLQIGWVLEYIYNRDDKDIKDAIAGTSVTSIDYVMRRMYTKIISTSVVYTTANDSTNVRIRLKGVEYDAVLNPLNRGDESDAMYTLAYNGIAPEFGDTWELVAVSENRIPISYYTGDAKGIVQGVTTPHLMLPEGTDYVDLKADMTADEVIEGVRIFTDIYPSMTNKVTEVFLPEPYSDVDEDGNVKKWQAYQVKDSSLKWDDSYKIDGADLKITFQTGVLAGLSFDVNHYDYDNEAFEIKRNTDGYGIPIPNDVMRPSVGDTFILSGYDTRYVDDALVGKAEEKLKNEAKKYLEELHKGNYTYDVTMNMIACHQRSLLDLRIGQSVGLNTSLYQYPNARIRAIERTIDDVTSVRYTLGKSAAYSRFTAVENSVESNVRFSEIGSSDGQEIDIDALRKELKEELRKEFLSKVDDDVASGQLTTKQSIAMNQGFEAGETDNPSSFIEGVRGAGLWWNGSGWEMQCDYLSVLKKQYAKSVEVDEVSHVGGQLLLTSASCVVDEVEESSTYYKLYFRAADSEGKQVHNEWQKGDYAYCQMYNINAGITEDFTNKYYWALVLESGTARGGERHYIRISKQSRDVTNTMTSLKDFTSVPSIGDVVVQLGNRTDISRQGAVFISGGAAGQYIAIYQGIKNFIMPEAKIWLSPDKTAITADEIKLAASGVLELKSDQLVCKNNDGDKTAWLDSLGNFNLKGIVNQLAIKVTDNNFAYFFDIISKDFSDVIYSRNSGDDITSWLHDKVVVPDILRIGGIVTFDNLTSKSLNTEGLCNLDILLPYYLPVVFDKDSSDYAFDVLRTKVNDSSVSDGKRYIEFDELQSLVGREIELHTSTHPLYLHFPQMEEIQYQGSTAYKFMGYIDHDYSIMNDSAVKFVYKSGVIVNNGKAVGYGVFPMCMSFGEFINPTILTDVSEATEVARDTWNGIE